MRVSRFTPQLVVSTTEGEPQPASDATNIVVKPIENIKNELSSEGGDRNHSSSRLGNLLSLIAEVQKRREKEKRRLKGGLNVYLKLINFDFDRKRIGASFNKFV